MKNLLKSVMVVLALLFVCVQTANADPACVPPSPNGGCFTGQVVIHLDVTQLRDLSVSIGAVVQQPLPSQDIIGNARVTQAERPVGSGSRGSISLDLRLGVIAGDAGPGFGAVFVTSTGLSPALIFINNGAEAQRVTFMATGTPDLHSAVAGFGTAGMSYVFSVVMLNEAGAIIGDEIGQITLQSITGNGDFTTESSIVRDVAVPVGGTVRIAIRGTITGNAAVPEPTTIFLLSTGLAGVAIKTRKKWKSRKGPTRN